MYDKKFLSKVTILYVEDEDETRKEFVEVFECFFKEVLVASDGYEALNIYKNAMQNQKEVDVIISDINIVDTIIVNICYTSLNFLIIMLSA